jgi:hypothetical protein
MASIGNSPTQQAFTPAIDYFSGNGSTTAFTLSRPVASVAQVQVVIDNVAQNPSSAYTVSSNTITFTSAPLSGTNNIYVYYTSPITQVIAPGQGTVGATQIDTAYALWNKSGSDITYTAGNVGIGVTPSAWSGYTALQIGTRASLATTGAATSVVQNAYNNGTNWIYLASSYASRYNQVSGQHEWYTAASGTAGNTATFTQAMTLDASGNLGIGTTSPGSKLYTQLSSATAYSSGVTGNGLTIYNSSATTNQYVGITLQGEPTSGNGGVATIMGTTTGSGNMDLTFSTRASATLAERMRIASDGAVLIGKTTVDDTTEGFIYRASKYLNLVRDGAPCLNLTRLTDNGELTQFRRSATQVGSITVTASATAYNTSSDYRLKKDIAPMTGALAKVVALKPCTYKWKVDGSDGQGFIAHELDEVVSGCVVGEKDAVDADGNPKYQAIDTSFLVATLTAAIQELKAINDTQAETINALTARIEALENR